MMGQQDEGVGTPQPKRDPPPVTMLGTYYADSFVGRKTSCGEIFRQNQYTAAHKTIPMGTFLLVRYIKTGLEIVVKVNDRCPRRGVLDLTKLAAHSIGINGSGRVEVRTLEPEEGYAIWVEQDTLAMKADEYYAYRDRSRRKRISPWPIHPDGTPGDPTKERVVAATAEKPKSEPPAVAKREKSAVAKQDRPAVTKPEKRVVNEEKKETVLQADTVKVVTDTVEQVVAPSRHLYDIELCVVNSMTAASHEKSRLPKDLQNKVTFKQNQINRQVSVVLALADSRSHAVRTQAMLIDDFPDSCLIPHQ